MPSLQFIERSLPIFEGPGLPAGDARLSDLFRLSREGEYEAAAKAAAETLGAGGYDVQVFVRYLLGVLLEHGLGVAPDVLDRLAETLKTFDPQARPNPTVTSTEVALTWLFRTTKEQLEYHQLNRTDRYTAWLAACDVALIEAIRASLVRLRGELGRLFKTSRCLESLSVLEAWFNTLRSAVASKPPPIALPAPVEMPAAAADPIGVAPPESPAPRSAPEPTPTQAVKSGAAGEFDSPALRVLLDKLAGFETLMERGDFDRAAVVANDLNHIVEHFDPKVYLPKLFSAYSRRLAAGIAEIGPHWEEAGSMKWKALEQLYQVDLDAFLTGP